jgi:hypothetical protein
MSANPDIDDPTLVNRYLADQLSDDEREAFEAELVRRPERLQELEATARVKVGLTQLRRRGELDPLLGQRRPVSGFTWLALAAALAMFGLGVLLFKVGVAPSGPPVIAASASVLLDRGGSVVLPVSSVHALFRSRAAGADAIIERSTAPRAVELRVMPTQAQPPRYRVSLSRLRDDGSAEPISSVANLQPQADGFVSVFADASRLDPGRYRLDISPEAAAGSEGDSFLIRVVPPHEK